MMNILKTWLGDIALKRDAINNQKHLTDDELNATGVARGDTLMPFFYVVTQDSRGSDSLRFGVVVEKTYYSYQPSGGVIQKVRLNILFFPGRWVGIVVRISRSRWPWSVKGKRFHEIKWLNFSMEFGEVSKEVAS